MLPVSLRYPFGVGVNRRQGALPKRLTQHSGLVRAMVYQELYGCFSSPGAVQHQTCRM